MRYMAITVLALLVAGVAFASNVDVDQNAPNLPPGPSGPVWGGPDNLVLGDYECLVTGPGACSSNSPPGDLSRAELTPGGDIAGYHVGPALPARIADNFVVPAGQEWNVQAITLFAYQTGSTTQSTINSVNMQVWNDPGPLGGNPADVICGDYTTNLLVFSAFSGIYRTFSSGTGPNCPNNRPVMANIVTPPDNCPDCPGFPGSLYLGPGTYWLDFQIAGSLSSGPWCPPNTPRGCGPPPVGNALDGLQFFGSWGSPTDPTDFPFVIEGDFCGVTPVEATTWGAIKSTLR